MSPTRRDTPYPTLNPPSKVLSAHTFKVSKLCPTTAHDEAPVLLGNDGRVWDGHHRIHCAHVLNIRMIPTTVAGT